MEDGCGRDETSRQAGKRSILPYPLCFYSLRSISDLAGLRHRRNRRTGWASGGLERSLADRNCPCFFLQFPLLSKLTRRKMDGAEGKNKGSQTNGCYQLAMGVGSDQTKKSHALWLRQFGVGRRPRQTKMNLKESREEGGFVQRHPVTT